MVLYCYGCSQLSPSSSSPSDQPEELKCPFCQSDFVQIMDDLSFFPLPGFLGQSGNVQYANEEDVDDGEDFEEFGNSSTITTSDNDDEHGTQSQDDMQNSIANDIFSFLRVLGAPGNAEHPTMGTIVINSQTAAPDSQQQTQLPNMRDLANFFNLMRSRFSGRSGIDWSSLFGIHGDPRDYAMGTEDFERIMHRLWEQASTEKGPGSPPLTEEQLTALERVPFVPTPSEDKQGTSQENAPDCSICKEVFKSEEKTIVLKCKHRYHEDCIVAWLRISGSCPVCRQQLQ